ncbi:TPA-induced transmembrane protein isoform X2 [Mesocricetus auratus]|uniref:TPA-induced transmembrane protein isoform X2 n=1 Tax=Mesocricetus auratus TaxID=10036 RepID=A0ABM2XVJ0_MESAU|nr:TPA-induced transmembrane protein isoform X2 [Mesocricetus auratus]
MEGARAPSPQEELELSILEGQREEETPLNTVHIQPCSAENPRPAQANKESPWSPCNRTVVGKLTYIDEDENEIPELSSNKTFFIMLKIPEECVNEEGLHHLLTKRLTDMYRESPSLSRYFTSAEIMDFSVENATVTYHLQFGVPAEDDGFMDYMMSEELVLGIIRQNFHDKNVSSCESLGLDPESLLLYE